MAGKMQINRNRCRSQLHETESNQWSIGMVGGIVIDRSKNRKSILTNDCDAMLVHSSMLSFSTYPQRQRRHTQKNEDAHFFFLHQFVR